MTEHQLSMNFTVERKPANDAAQTEARLEAWAPAIPTPVLDLMWVFADRRQKIFFRRLGGLPPPWTRDPILAAYKFTNAYRASDRVSQYLIRHVIYTGHSWSREDLFFRILLFKFFNKIETWERLERAVGPLTWESYRYEVVDHVLCQAMKAGQSIYSAAYIMPSGTGFATTERKHQAHLKLLELMMADDVPHRLAAAPGMAAGFDILRSYPMIGDFLAYQFVTDLNYSTLTDFTEVEFVVPGPGAKDGLHKCFASFGGLSEVEIIARLTRLQASEFARLGLVFQKLGTRNLQYIDVQNLLCEVAKYARVTHPELPGLTGRTRIKQRFKPTSAPIEYVYPPKWNVGELGGTPDGAG